MNDKFNRLVCFVDKEKSLAIIHDKYDYIIVSGIVANSNNVLFYKNVEHFVKDLNTAINIVNNFDLYMSFIEKQLIK